MIAEADSEQAKFPLTIQADKQDFRFFRCDPKDPDSEYISAFYGLRDFPSEQLITGSMTEMKKVSYMTKELNQFLQADSKHQLNIISLGCELFARNQAKNSANVECIYRLV